MWHVILWFPPDWLSRCLLAEVAIERRFNLAIAVIIAICIQIFSDHIHFSNAHVLAVLIVALLPFLREL